MSTFGSFNCEKVIDCGQGAIRAIRYNVDGTYCFSCGSDKTIKLWNPNTGMLLKTYAGHANEVTDAVGNSESSHFVSSSLDKSIIYWDVSTGRPVKRLRTHFGGVFCVTLNDDTSLALSGSQDNTVCCWDLRSRNLEPVQVLKDAKDCITSIISSQHKIFTSSLDGTIRQYDMRKHKLVCDNAGVAISYLVSSRDEHCLLAACNDNTLRLIDCDSGIMLSEYTGHKTDDFYIECGILGNDTHVISGTTNGEAILWDLMDNKLFKTIKINSKGSSLVNSLDTHPRHNQILFASKQNIFVFSIE